MNKRHIFKCLVLSVLVLSFFGCGAPAHKAPLTSHTKPEVSCPQGEIAALSENFDIEIKEQLDYDNPDMPLSHSDKIRRNLSDTKNQPELDEALELCDLAQNFWQKGELENAIDTLDHAYALILEVNDGFSTQQKDDLRFLISKRILEIYASRNVVVNGKHNEIPMTLNSHVQREIDLFIGREKGFFLSSYQRSGMYRDKIVTELKAAGLPEELSWLPLIESGYKSNALSVARALGLWQFIPSTGYKFGLKRDKFVDERLDPDKSTLAAIAYLKELHDLFGDWSTVLAAYNCGEGRVLRVIREQNINYLDNFWDLYERLPRETSRYVPRFLATLHVVKNPEKYGITLPAPDAPLAYETVTVAKPVHLKDIAAKFDIPIDELKKLNPELRYNILPEENYSLRMPPGKGEILLAEIHKIPVSQPPSPAYAFHKVRSGETLSSIANRYKTSVKSVMYANGMRRSNYIVVGTTLKIPLRGTVVYNPSVGYKQPKSQPVSQYTVKSGDSLWNIAKRFGTTTTAIRNLNNLTKSSLKIGQKLKIPGKVYAKNSSVYVVKRGDSPALIAKNHRMTVSRLLSLNKLTPTCKIFPGQQLYIE